MKKRILSLVIISIIALSCNEGSNNSENSETNNNIDSSGVNVPEISNEEESNDEIAFNGIDKGDYKLYGHSEIDNKSTVSTETMFTTFIDSGSFNGKVEVTINEVCQKAGCWINFKKNESETVMVFFRDHYTIPIDSSAGKHAILYGNLISDTLSIDFQKHLLDDATEAGETVKQEEYDAITEDKIELSFDCEAILVAN